MVAFFVPGIHYLFNVRCRTFNLGFWWLSAAELPLPIPNRVVKRGSGDDTRKGKVTSRRNRGLNEMLTKKFYVLTFF